MPALVQLLAAGVNGALNGSATFVLRGTASSAASVLYNDFEGTAQPGTNVITLDANGAAEVYCDAYCDITLKTSAGVTLRTVTIGNAASTVEVVSDSFTGVDYSGSPTAVNEPITLAAVLNKWDDSAGADDWKILVEGVAVNLSAAFSSISGIVFNVKNPTFGAVGDGATDDTNAINAAITAANAAGGGIVWFPATTSNYRFTTLTIASANITLMGAGPKASILRSSTTSSDLITFTNNTSGAWKRIIGLGIEATGATSNDALVFEETQQVYMENCDLTCSSLTGSAVLRTSGSGKTTITMKDCHFTVGASTDAALNNTSADSDTIWRVINCRFTVPASFNNDVITGPNFNVSNCLFDASAVTSGIYRHINATSAATPGKYLGRFVNNTFIDGGSTGFAFQLVSIATSSDFHEDGNVFEGFTGPADITDVGHIYNVSHAAHDAAKIYLGSRRGRTIEMGHGLTATANLGIFTSYEVVYISYTGPGNINLNAPVSTMVAGSEIFLALFNNSAAQRDIVWEMGASDSSVNATTDNGAPSTNVTNQPQDQETVYSRGYFIHNGSGAPFFILTTSVED